MHVLLVGRDEPARSSEGLERVCPLVEKILGAQGHSVAAPGQAIGDEPHDVVLSCGHADLSTDLKDALAEQNVPFAALLLDEHLPQIKTPQAEHNTACVSRWLRRRLVERGVPVQDAQVIRPGIPLETFPAKKTPGSLHAPLRLLHVGCICPNRGIENLLEAACLVAEARGPETVRVTLAGQCDPGYQADLAQKSSAGVAVEFAGSVLPGEAALVYRDHDIFVWPVPTPVPFSLVHLEAMASGLVVISTALGGVVEVMRDSENGFVILPDRPKQLANRISRLVNDPGLAQNLATSARSHVEQHFSMERFAADLDAFLARAVARTGA